MAYHIYHTEAIILGAQAMGDGDRIFSLYTRDLGLLFAHAKSVREGRSRLRYALQTFAHVEVDLIRGKHGWKIISARSVDPLADVWRDEQKRYVLAQHAQLLRRLIQGEEEHAALFEDLLAGISVLARKEDPQEVRAVELIFVVRVLARLGYWEQLDRDHILLGVSPWEDAALAYVQTARAALLVDVNRALAASQL